MQRLQSIVLAILLCPLTAFAQVSLGDDTSSFGRSIHVHATGSPAENGTALTDALTSDIITGRSDPATEPVLIQLGPGLFELSAGLDLPDNSTLRGAGINATTITCPGCFVVFELTGSNKVLSHISIIADDVPIFVNRFGEFPNSEVDIRNVKTSAPLGIAIAASVANITDSTLLSTTNDALALLGDAVANVAATFIDGLDSASDGIIRGLGTNNTLNISYSFIGPSGITNPWPGPENCAYITTGPPLSAHGGCPPVPAPAVGAAQSMSNGYGPYR